MSLFDTHTHIFLWNLPERRDEIISNLQKSWVKYIASIGIDLPSSEECIELSKKYDFIFPTVGIHPMHTKDYSDNLDGVIQKLEKMIIQNPGKIIGIWECGLDYYRIDKNNIEAEKIIQKEFFVAQIKLAQKYNLPIIIHTREAKDDTLEIIKETGLKKFILHCYSEDLDFAYKCIYYSEECKISFSWIVSYKNALSVQSTAQNIPIDKILIETDCPYLSPQPVRGLENEPAYVRYNLEKIANLRNMDIWKLEEQIFKNSIEFFGIRY